VGVERHGHHVGTQCEQGEAVLESGSSDPELQYRLPLRSNALGDLSPTFNVDSAQLAAVRLQGRFELAHAMEMRDRRSGIDAPDVLLGDNACVLPGWSRAVLVGRVGDRGVAGGRDDQLVQLVSLR